MSSGKTENATRVYELTLGYTCNYNCAFCSIAGKKGLPPKTTSEALADIAQARREGFLTIGFGGGEPTIRPDIVKLAAFAKRAGFQTIRVQTNGIMLSYPAFAKQLIDAGAGYIKFSIHGHRAEIHDKLTMVKGSFDRAVAGLRNARALGARTSVDIVINRQNYRFLPQYVEYFALREGVSGIGFIYPIYEGAMKTNARRLGVKMSEAQPYVKEAVELARDILLDRHIIFNMPYCLFEPEFHPLIPGAKLKLKVNSPGQVEENVFLGSKESKLRPPACAACPKLEECGGIWKNYAAVFGLAEADAAALKGGRSR
ncbi:MAG TPA: radical SAM protein [Elusimicrobiales bacterium]|nr:radical SAM protein [Elusimicrobiales bacterium]